LADFIVYVFVSGLAFFVGAAMLTVGAAVGLSLRWRWGRSVGRALVIAGLAFVWLSSTPMALWRLPAALVLAGLWLIAEVGRPRFGPVPLRLASCALFAFVLGPVLSEWGECHRHVFPRAGTRTFYVIGDSISGGTGIEGEVLWPEVLDRLMPRNRAMNLAEPGATCATALAQARQLPERDACVLLEIGGNDLLAGEPPAAFRRDLEALLREALRGDRAVVMFELPLPPFHAAYGRIQRELADKYAVGLIPKRYFARIIMSPGDTIDGLHLSAKGHERMAETVRGLLSRD